ncbi:uncharacterized protein SPPG_05705 [Spizellomyces punctatus DAOM BR117]|uniref:Endonuclease/exonuclease/phosphatase domain-containing protein n=1 Tax=Spizellomyces punctatus (strain DAOM BR117) TaxID=645134 RepID=A0A0L0HDA0_SPIPD|nr:uncharacterized protein SPPG_05705 [Spizellomyces punctatus DAOM BR117]KNC99470.1 hypothetical protein SPPG_05705 [Spizellomyces punctatus DAOM BR117]|eukprot:XP_016607510.1 hypothetical protein SPPG_05705 [Spizellomyces punctatus DAOM BR117]
MLGTLSSFAVVVSLLLSTPSLQVTAHGFPAQHTLGRPLHIEHVQLSGSLLLPRPKRPTRPTPRLCSQAPVEAGDRRENKDELTVGNFNAEWLFINGGTGGLVCPGRSCPWKNKKMALEHFSRVAKTIAAMGLPDIVHLSEVESCDALDKLIEVLEAENTAAKGAYRAYLVPGRDTALGQQVGFITKVDPIIDVIRTDERVLYPIKGSLCGFTKPGSPPQMYGSTKNYFARFQVNEIPILLSGNHFIAYPDKRDRCEKREAQASVISNAIQRHLLTQSHDEVIVLGDFNDYDDEVVDAAGELDHPISKALSTLRTATNPPLFNIANLWENQTERYTNWYDRNRDCKDDGGNEHVLIDHVLISRGLRDRLVDSYPLHNYKQYCGTLDSDHWPIFARFDVRKDRGI